MKKRKSPSLIPLDLESLSSVLEIYPDTDLGDEVAHYLLLCDEVASVFPSTNEARREYMEWLKLHSEEVSHIRPKSGLGYTATPKNLMIMSADTNALASDWRRVGLDIAAADELLRKMEPTLTRKKDQEALKHG